MTTPLPPLILLDGGLGTSLVDLYNITFNDTTPLWSSHLLLTEKGRKILLDLQTAFASSGADVILSATYQASFEGFRNSGIEDEAEAGKLMRGGVEIARLAVEKGEKRDGKVALSLGAYGATMVPGQEYSGVYDAACDSVEGLRAWHFRRLEVFLPLSGGNEGEKEEREKCWENVDLVAFETLPRVDEVSAVRQVMGMVEEVVGEGKRKGFWISCVFPGEGNALPDGSSIGQVVQAMLGKGKGPVPMGVGINCTRVGKVEGLVREFEREIVGVMERGEVEEWPSLVVYPDGTRGEVYDTVTKEWVKTRKDEESSVSTPFFPELLSLFILIINRFLGMKRSMES